MTDKPNHTVTFLDPVTQAKYSMAYNDDAPAMVTLSSEAQPDGVEMPFSALMQLAQNYYLDVVLDHLEHRPVRE